MMDFAEAVLGQAGRPLGAGSDPAREVRVAGTLAQLLEHARDEALAREDAHGIRTRGASLDPVRALASDPLLLAAFFQNVDLLYDAGAREGDLVAGWVMAAVDAVSAHVSGMDRPAGQAERGTDRH